MNEEEKQILEERYPRAIDYIDYLKEEIRKLQNKLEIEKKKSYKSEYFEEVSYAQSMILKKIKTYPVEFKDDRLILLVDKTLINNGMYETNYVSKEDVKNKLDNLIEKLEKANLGGFADETRDIKEELLEEIN